MAESKKSESKKTLVSRREFLVGSGAVIAAGALTACNPVTTTVKETMTTTLTPTTIATTATVTATVPPSKLGHIVCDTKYCAECQTCEAACSLSHEGIVKPELSRIRIVRDEINPIQAVVNVCRQCNSPSCVAACPTGALYVDKSIGARVIDETKCIGCQLCMAACPFEVSRIGYNATTNKCFKCDLCGGDPLCIKLCTTLALKLEKGGA